MSAQHAADESAVSNSELTLIAEQRIGPGIIMLTQSLQLLHMDRRSWELCGQINRTENGKAANGVLPAPVSELAAEIVRLLRERTDAKDWEQFQVRRMCGGPAQPVMVRGFGLPDRQDPRLSRVLLMLESVTRRQRPSSANAKERFQLTDREHVVVQKLSKGWTNKEIANSLGIAEQTVKEHIKRIMQKTQTTTRTGVLVRMFEQ